jgi:hypothetical protein
MLSHFDLDVMIVQLAHTRMSKYIRRMKKCFRVQAPMAVPRDGELPES